MANDLPAEPKTLWTPRPIDNDGLLSRRALNDPGPDYFKLTLNDVHATWNERVAIATPPKVQR